MNKTAQNEVTEIISQKIGDLILEKKGRDVSILDVRKITPMTDFFVICTSDSHPQTNAIYKHVQDSLLEDDIKPWHIEGAQKKDWVLMDYVNIVVNIFSPESREFYNLERLWGDADITELEQEESE